MASKKFSKEDIKLIISNTEELKKVAKLAFDVVDTDKSGSVTFEELEKLMIDVSSKVGCPKPTKKDVEGALKAMDTDNDGKISLQEFTVLVKELLLMMMEM